MKKIALIGAGGKMGMRIGANLAPSDFSVAHVEVSDVGQARLRDELGVEPVEAAVAIADADAVILAVPDTLIQKISHQLEPLFKPGTMIIILDAAGPFAGHLPDRDDLVYFITHPCHPPIFNDETDMEAKRDHFGGIAAKQGVTNSLMQGPDEAYAMGDAISRVIYAPVARTYRVTVEQMALLEPVLSETVCATLLTVMREAMDEVVARGVPKEAARDFLLGHMNILGAVIFDEVPGVFSDACNKAIEFGKPDIIQSDWKKIFEKDAIAESIQRIT